MSNDGGQEPRWGPDSQELFYRSGNTLMVLPIENEPEFLPGLPEELFTWERRGGSFFDTYDVSADGQRFVLVGEVEGESRQPPTIRVVQNWYEEFRDRE